MTQNPILEKNLNCIARYNRKLKEDVLALKELTQSFELTQTDLGEPTLKYNGENLHSQVAAEIEAKSILDKTTNTPYSVHVVFGIGIGHLFKEFCEQSKGVVILYEPNLEILRVTMELVDFSPELAKRNVFVVSTLDALKQIYIKTYFYNAAPTISFLSSYKKLWPRVLDEVYKLVEITNGICIADYNTMKSNARNSVQMMYKNVAITMDETPLLELGECFKGKTALIVSAGPSLDQNIDTIKKNREKVVIFSVGTALKALVSNGIMPDFLNVIEVNDCSSQIEGIDLSNVYMILEPYTHNIFHNKKVKRKFLFPTIGSEANMNWSKLVDLDLSPYQAKGTVSYEALLSAKMMGFEKIILIGQDLAFANNQCYSKYSAYNDLVYQINPQTNQIEIKPQDYNHYVNSLISESLKGQENMVKDFVDYKIKNLNDTLFYVKGVTGEMIPTQGNYATFIEHFREFGLANKHLNLINTSMIGAQIDGFKNIPLETALENVSEVKRPIELNAATHVYDKNSILQNLKDEKTYYEKIITEFDKSEEYFFKYEREYNRYKSVTAESNKYFKQLLSLYIQINETYKNPGFQSLSFAEKIEVDYILKNFENIDLQRIEQAFEKLKWYFTGVKLHIQFAINIIGEQIGIIESKNQ